METLDFSLLTKIIYREENRIWVAPVCNFFKIDLYKQHAIILNDNVLRNMHGKNKPDVEPAEGCGLMWLTPSGFVRWVQRINANQVPEAMAEMFTRFQDEVTDYVYYVFDNYTIMEGLRIEYEVLREKRKILDVKIEQVRRDYEHAFSILNQFRSDPVVPERLYAKN